MLAAWSLLSIPERPSTSNSTEDQAHIIVDIDGYLTNFNFMLDSGWAQITQGPVQEIDDVFAILLLAFTKWIGKYEYFIDVFKTIPEGNKIFAALATLFPWNSEETWSLLRRAESNILRDQRAKFIPELNEYAILLIMNPEILAIENNISKAKLTAWKYVIIPAVQAIVSTVMEEKIYANIQARPLSYITSPYYYYRPHGYMYYTTLHYHTTG